MTLEDEAPEAGADPAYEAPQSAMERRLAKLWAEVLGAARVGRHDDFFLLGGDSVLVTQALVRIRAELGGGLSFLDFFDGPTVAALAARLEAAAATAEPAIEPVAEGVPRPLSFMQERLWLLDRLEPGAPVHNRPTVFLLQGRVDVGALEESLNAIVERHEVLRALFPERDGRPAFELREVLRVAMPVVELRDASEEAVRRAVDEEVGRPFCLATGPLVRGLLVRRGAAEHLLVLTFHHIVFDGESVHVLLRELVACYDAFAAGRTPRLPAPAVRYVDYAGWQRRRLTSGRMAGSLAYWRARLEGLEPLALPADRLRPPVQTSRAATLDFRLPPALVERLSALARSHDATLFMVLLAAFDVLLGRYAERDDVAVGVPVAGRLRPEAEELVGFFVNMLVVRTDLSGEPSFATMLERVRRDALGAYQHQEVPFEKVVEALQPTRDRSRNPLFQVLFNLERVAAPGEAGGLRFEEQRYAPPAIGLDLSVELAEREGGLEGTLAYDTDLFDAPRMARMAAHYRRLLEAVLRAPDAPVGTLSFLTEAERERLAAWNVVRPPAADAPTLSARFEAAAARTPEAVAVVCDVERWTYRRLRDDAWCVARYLAHCGVRTGGRVGIAMRRTPALAAAVLGVLRAGAAYVSLDPDYPAERLRLMAADVGIRHCLVDDAAHAPDLGSGVTLLPVGEAMRAAKGALPAPPTGNDLAYLIYTSGSTGRPKGVPVRHRDVAPLLDWAECTFDAHERSRLLASTTLSFDLSVFELFTALTTGGAVVLVENLLAFPDARAASEVTLVNTVPSVMQTLLDVAALPSSVQTVVLCGEPLRAALVDRLYALGHVHHVYDVYGPTEDTVYATCARREPGGRETIGRPIGGKRAYVLDRHGNPAPVGVPGELYLGGAGVVEGYHDLPEQTHARFVPDPFVAEPSARLYRTGDWTRFLEDGSLVFMGRMDDQVKIRGFRVEPGEVVAVLRRQDGVHEAVVTVGGGASEDRFLAAYVVPASEADPDRLEDHLRRRAAEVLPSYMRPSHWMMLASLPRLPNGKVDRSALPDPAHIPAGQGTTAPRTALEMQLLTLWEDVLEGRPLGVTDDFFEQGGHSLLAVRLFARIEERFGRRLPLTALFQAPTVAHLAEVLADELGEPPTRAVVPLRKAGAKTPFFCVHGAGGGILRFHELSRYWGSARPFYGLQREPKAAENGKRGTGSIAAMAAAYVEEIVTAFPQGPYYIGGYSLGGLIAFEMVRQLEKRDHDASLVLLDTKSLYLSGWKEKLKRLGHYGARVVHHVRGGTVTTGLKTFLTLGRHPDRASSEREEESEDSGAGPARTEEEQWGDQMARHRRAGQRYRVRTCGCRTLLVQCRIFREQARTEADLRRHRTWWAHRVGLLETRVVGGTHLSMLEAPNAAQVADVIGAFLDHCDAPRL